MIWFLGWEDPLEKEMMTTPVFLPGKFHGQRSWWAAGHEVTKSQAKLSTHACTPVPFIPILLSFDHNWVSNFVKSSFCIYWGDYMVFVLQFITVVYCILICGYWTILDIASLDKSFLIERYVLLMYCWNQFADTSLRIFVFISDTGM